jgi:hypothetical protein
MEETLKAVEAVDENKTPEWQVTTLFMNFHKGYEYASDPKDTKDRYEGKITFENDRGHAFALPLDNKMCQEFRDIVADKVIESADEMAAEIRTSLNSK